MVLAAISAEKNVDERTHVLQANELAIVCRPSTFDSSNEDYPLATKGSEK